MKAKEAKVLAKGICLSWLEILNMAVAGSPIIVIIVG
jgi:hypothetical protein